MRVIVVGAGVIGLSCAVRLAESGYDVAVFARDLPLETTSAVAAAIWYPFLSAPEDRVAAWSRASYEEFSKLAESEPSVRLRQGREYLVDPRPTPVWASAVPDLERVGSPPPGFSDGWSFTAPVIEMPVYLPYLVKRLESAGGTLTRAALSALPTAADVVVNAAGLGARLTASDPTVTPVRGQVLTVEQPGLTEWLIADRNPRDLTYVVPRENDVVVGGTNEPDSWDLSVNQQTAEQLLARATDLIPQLRKAKILRHRVGLRPARPAVRCEAVHAGPQRIIHCYGHGGAGVTLSWGCADEVLDLVREAG
ncbi:D-amino-acid oxidase [Kribbella orskensis]|uniref:D-amino-acid oxidase n=1 Tax=Kribbella orskensis TaxID=2512216 RepID=A0ABY2BHR7_9ACTN|nr:MULTISPECIES: FAD-dependent oxidoreductase [Kribbella]TCN38259.1 D-amino-acid oxidase [Kribbella sp. VKM Ac-2500]TCO20211.1 D-amino-acid oxidase [Kribbella orskensis]